MRKLLIIGLVYLVACGSKPAAEEEYTIDTAKPLVERIVLLDLEGKEISLSSFKGKTIFLNFWATWCKPCVKEMPSMAKANDELADQNFVFLAASDEGIERIKKFVAMQDFSFQFVQLKGDIFDLDIKALPTTFVINAEGEIVYNEVGARDWQAQENIDMLLKFSKL